MKNADNKSMDLLKFRCEFFFYGHLLNPLWRKRDERRYERLKAKNRAIRNYLSRYRDTLVRLNPPVPDDSSEEPTRIFSIWFQGEENAPHSVRACFDSMRRHLDQELVVIDANSITQWISLPEYIIRKWKEGKIGRAHFSDICRVELLFQHGGLWFDATDYVTGAIPGAIMDSDFFVFMGGQKVNSWYGYIQNCFIRGKKGNPLLGLWREAMYEYWRHEDKTINYYVHQILFQVLTETNDIARSLFAKMPRIDQDPTHVLWYQHKDDAYEKDAYDKWTSPTFFQKTDFKQQSARNPLPGTIAAYLFGSKDK